MTLNGEMALIFVILPNLVVALIWHYFNEFVYDVVVKQIVRLASDSKSTFDSL